MIQIDTIYNEDCIETMKRMPDNFIDLTVTSPPYDNLRKYNGFCFDFENVAKQLYRVTKEGGVLVWNVGDGTVDGSETCTSFRQALYFVEIGFKLNDTMIWRKTNPMPQVLQKRYRQVFEYMFVFSKGLVSTFNPIMEDCQKKGKMYNSTVKNMGGEKGRTFKTFAINDKKALDNVWDIGVAQNKTEHPAVMPEKLAADHIRSWSNEGDLVYDCFMGSGTTAKMAMTLNRHYIGSEISEEYCNIIDKRLLPLKTQYRLF